MHTKPRDALSPSKYRLLQFFRLPPLHGLAPFLSPTVAQAVPHRCPCQPWSVVPASRLSPSVVKGPSPPHPRPAGPTSACDILLLLLRLPSMTPRHNPDRSAPPPPATQCLEKTQRRSSRPVNNHHRHRHRHPSLHPLYPTTIVKIVGLV